MEATKKKLLEYIEGKDKNFIIPVYQRNYDWEKEQCRQLMNDLKNIIENKIKNYFLGSMVSIYSMDNSRLIIDGQQRLTTISLLLLSISHLTDDEEMKEEIRETYLINKRSKDQKKKIKLKPIKKDEANFTQLIKTEGKKNKEDFELKSNIVNNYFFFYDELKKENLKDIYEAINELLIVDIELKQDEDDPQKIFESLNATGIALDEGDKIRNFILMNEKSERQEYFYNDYWSVIEKNTEENTEKNPKFKVNDFVRHFLTYEEQKTPKEKKVYFEFKSYYQKKFPKSNQKEESLKKLLSFSKYYKIIITSEHSNKKISQLLKDIHELKVTVSYPFLLALFFSLEEKKLTDEQVIETLNVIVIYCFRRIICEIPSNALNSVFETLYSQIEKTNNGVNEQFVEILKYKLGQKSGSSIMPKDNDFKKNLLQKDIYKMRSSYYLFRELENHQNKEPVKMDGADKPSIEHIMPRKLTSKWKDALGEKWEEVHNKYLNVLGNLTLTGYNPNMSNKSFKEKKASGFSKSRLKLNKYFEPIDEWNENEINKRGHFLVEKSLKVWTYPETSFAPLEPEPDTVYSLADEEDFTYKKITAYSFLEDKFEEVNIWNKFLIKVLENIYEMDKSIFANFSSDVYFKKYINTLKEGMRKSKKVKDSPYFVETSLSCEHILTLLRKVVEKTDLELTDIKFIIEKED